MEPSNLPNWLVRAAVLVCGGLIAVRVAFEFRNDAFVLDVDVPGTRVFVNSKCLGTVPVRFTEGDLEWIAPDSRPDLSEKRRLISTRGEGLSVGSTHHPAQRIDLEMPSTVAGQFVPYETPWGVRHKVADLSYSPPMSSWWWSQRAKYSVRMMRPGEVNGLVVQLSELREAPQHHVVGRTPLELTVTNTASVPIRDVAAPKVRIHWGTLRTPTFHSSTEIFPLSREWRHLESGQSRTIRVDIPTPSVAEDYSVFAELRDFPGGPVFSNSRLLRVR
jgi:hypothetical protein